MFPVSHSPYRKGKSQQNINIQTVYGYQLRVEALKHSCSGECSLNTKDDSGTITTAPAWDARRSSRSSYARPPGNGNRAPGQNKMLRWHTELYSPEEATVGMAHSVASEILRVCLEYVDLEGWFDDSKGASCLII